MPDYGGDYYRVVCHCWKHMSRGRRKAFHQENARRELKGKQLLPKPIKCNCGYGGGV